MVVIGAGGGFLLSMEGPKVCPGISLTLPRGVLSNFFLGSWEHHLNAEGLCTQGDRSTVFMVCMCGMP